MPTATAPRTRTASGASWSAPFATISNALARATNGQTVLVGPGTYSVSAPLNVATNVTLLGLGGAANTIVRRASSATNRVLSLTHPGAVVDGLTITNGSFDTGAGVYVAAGTVRNCLVSGNNSFDYGPRDFGAGVHMAGGVVSNCTIAANRGNGGYAKGGGVYGSAGLLVNCLVDTNRANENGSGICLAGSFVIRGCAVVNNFGGANAVYFYNAGFMENGTVSRSPVVGVMVDGTGRVTNSISYFNPGGDGRAGDAAKFAYSCGRHLTDGVSGNTTNDPAFTSVALQDFTLRKGSPCIDRGVQQPWMSGASDRAGTRRVVNAGVDMGAYEARGAVGSVFVLR